MTLISEIIEVMRNSNGECHLKDLYEKINYPSDSIRKCLYTYSKDSMHFGGKKDIFKCVHGVNARKGIWALKTAEEMEVSKNLFDDLKQKTPHKEKFGDISKNLSQFKNKSLPELREGETIERKILTHKRNQTVVKNAKYRDSYACQICGFNFYQRIIEAHHLTPLSIKETEYTVKTEDLITLCPNCHSMAHYLLKEDRELYSNKEFLVEKLKELVTMHYNIQKFISI